MNVPPVSVESVQKCAVNFEIYRFLKKAANLPHPPLYPGLHPVVLLYPVVVYPVVFMLYPVMLYPVLPHPTVPFAASYHALT